MTESSVTVAVERGAWRNRLGFILAASGSAIGLGNIVFFSANATRYGGGAFYIPYLVALFLIGIPVMIVEFGLGTHTGRSFPEAMRQVAGRKGEFVGWLALLNAFIITCYYIVILAWVLGMLGGSLGELWESATRLGPPWAKSLAGLGNPQAYFFGMLSSYWPIVLVVGVWILNVVLVWRGASTIEAAVRFLVPTMWIFMIVLIVRGVTLEGGLDGVTYLFTPDFETMKNPQVWQGAFSQIFFTLSLGFGIMTAYASYLPKDTDTPGNALTTSFLNCGFEYMGGVAVFSMLFALTVLPKSSGLLMMFFVVPQGIAKLPFMVSVFGVLFFVLLFIAGISSSISLVEGFLSALVDKFSIHRRLAAPVLLVAGCLGSVMFALPQVIDPNLDHDGTMGLTLLDLMDHWAFSYGLLIIGFLECVLIAWTYGFRRIREQFNAHSRFRLGPWFDYLVGGVIPAVILGCLVLAFLTQELHFQIPGEHGLIGPRKGHGIYGTKVVASLLQNSSGGSHPVLGSLHWICLGVWILFPIGGALIFTLLRERRRAL